jgi:hypothetical protein
MQMGVPASMKAETSVQQGIDSGQKNGANRNQKGDAFITLPAIVRPTPQYFIVANAAF